jgi:hypothetical protein
MAGKGGKREGAGRKSNAVKLAEAQFVAGWFTESFQEIKWKSLVNSADENVSVRAMCYLTDRIYGKAPQALDVTSKGERIAQCIVNV